MTSQIAQTLRAAFHLEDKAGEFLLLKSRLTCRSLALSKSPPMRAEIMKVLELKALKKKKKILWF